MSYSYERVGVNDDLERAPLQTKIAVQSAPQAPAGHFPTVWLVFCYIFAGFTVIAGITVLVGGPYVLEHRWTFPPDRAIIISLVVVSFPISICAPIAVALASHKSVLWWSIVHGLGFVAILILTVFSWLYAASVFPIFSATMSACHFAFCCLYIPLNAIKNLQRHARVGNCRCTCNPEFSSNAGLYQ